MFKLTQARQTVTRWFLILAFAVAVASPLVAPTPIFANEGCSTSTGSGNCGG